MWKSRRLGAFETRNIAMTTLVEDCPDIQNVSFVADSRPDNRFGFRAIIWTYADPDATDPAEQKRGVVVAERTERFLAANPACTGITYKLV
jgi:hypothetical protein